MTKYWVGEPLRPSPSLRSQPLVHYLTTNTRGRDKWGRCLSLTDKSEHDIRIMLYRIKLATNKKQIPTWRLMRHGGTPCVYHLVGIMMTFLIQMSRRPVEHVGLQPSPTISLMSNNEWSGQPKLQNFCSKD